MLEVAFWLIVGHAMGDFGLQSDWMARFKSRHSADPCLSSRHPGLIWVHVLGSHCMIHGGAVALATGSVILGICETIAHFIIDFGKSEGWYGFHADQLLHLGCKGVWLGLLYGVMNG